MSIIQTQTNSFKNEIFLGLHCFGAGIRPADTFKMALYTPAAQLDATTTAYTTTGEVVATGYTAGGQVIYSVNPANSGLKTGGVTFFGFSGPVSWTSQLTSNGALIYNASQNNRSVCVLAFGNNISSLNGVFTVNFPNNTYTTALLRYF